MTVNEANLVVSGLLKQCDAALDIAKTAARNNKTLRGENFYSGKFSNAVIGISRSEAAVVKIAHACELESHYVEELSRAIATLKSDRAQNSDRRKALNRLRMICEAELLPRIEKLTPDPTPQTERVLPMDVVRGTRGYLERIIQQSNGCYERQWYDAASVMIRKFIEILIIEVYEANGRETEIKDANGDYFMLSDLVSRLLAQTYWPLGRETKRELPNFKKLGDRAAHTRHYVATKPDVDKLLDGLRITADTLLHLAKLK